ncbi:MAG TPA: protein kinase [Thermoanaerobaculia bacterium]|nr:protein kinase [Thermoanaerobaculia bacterium]
MKASEANANRDVAAIESGPVAAAPHPVERARFPLFLRLLLGTAFLILLVVGLSVGGTIFRANKIASASVNDSIKRAASLFRDFERLRYDQLSLAARYVGQDSGFHAYIQGALLGEPADGASTSPAGPGAQPSDSPTSADTVSIGDALAQRRAQLRSDLLVLTDDQGNLVFRTDQPDLTGAAMEDMYETQPLLKLAIDQPQPEPLTGVISMGDKLYHAAIAPVNVGASRAPIAFLINASAIDSSFANQIAEKTKAAVLFLPPPGSKTKGDVPRSNNAPAVGNLSMSPAVRRLLSTGKMAPVEVEKIDGTSYLLTGEQLSALGKPLGAAVFVRSLDSELGPFREIEKTLLLTGGAALLIALALSWLIARRLTRPVQRLAAMAQSVAAGNYSMTPDQTGTDEIGILSRSFAKMINSLRDKDELEDLYEKMASREGEPARYLVEHPPKAEEGTIMVTDLRGIPTSVSGGDAASVIALIAQAMRLQEAEIQRHDGSVREVVGHRLVSCFLGNRSVVHAIRAARAISEELSLNTTEHPLSMGAGIATGEFVTGSIQLEQSSGLAIAGNAPLLALLFAWEAPTSFAFISLESGQSAGSEVIAKATREEVRLRWLASPLPAYSLSLQTLTTSTLPMKTLSDATIRLDDLMGGANEANLAVGSTFAGRYNIEQEIGRGGMGVVYRANDQQLAETVAIKTLPARVVAKSPEDLERFKREIRLARKITHRNVLRTFDYGEADGVHFISMEYVRGYTLNELKDQSGEMSVAASLGIARQISRGLEAAHEEGIVHRDIKPQNVLIDSKGTVKLMDFGIARMAESGESMTAAGLVIGTPFYMSPEQVQGKQLDARSDVYSTGILIYELLSGSRPFQSTSLTAVLAAHITETPKPLIDIRPEVGAKLSVIVMRCLAKDPAVRYATAGELLSDLDTVSVTPAVAA